MFSYKIEFKDSKIQELLTDWGFQVWSVRKILYKIFPNEKKFIRETIPERILRRKLCWKDEHEFTDIEMKIKKFYKDKCIEKIPSKRYSCYCDKYFDDFYDYLTVNPKQIYHINYLEEGRHTDYYLAYLRTQKYKMKIRFRLEVIRKLREHFKTPQGYDIIRYC